MMCYVIVKFPSTLPRMSTNNNSIPKGHGRKILQFVYYGSFNCHLIALMKSIENIRFELANVLVTIYVSQGLLNLSKL